MAEPVNPSGGSSLPAIVQMLAKALGPQEQDVRHFRQYAPGLTDEDIRNQMVAEPSNLGEPGVKQQLWNIDPVEGRPGLPASASTIYSMLQGEPTSTAGAAQALMSIDPLVLAVRGLGDIGRLIRGEPNTPVKPQKPARWLET